MHKEDLELNYLKWLIRHKTHKKNTLVTETVTIRSMNRFPILQW